MNIAKFLERWGTEGGSIFIRQIVDNPKLLERDDVRSEAKRFADNLQAALASASVEATPLLHECIGGAGSAFYYCLENRKGELFVYDGSCNAQVSFCPYCGFKARTAATGVRKSQST